ncbi:hypothetical protein EYF80_021960 [Liparis tanakae]|uniref:Uncharacterized protein n=1 Tax=Liparis tanakae TaxID=230148 RepID=A0A4Z2HPM7_9TELE|nr:hypothetical protein EYF80_021960 [Liparis tanakae]
MEMIFKESRAGGAIYENLVSPDSLALEEVPTTRWRPTDERARQTITGQPLSHRGRSHQPPGHATPDKYLGTTTGRREAERQKEERHTAKQT